MRDDNEPIGLDHKLVISNEAAAATSQPHNQAGAEVDLHKTPLATGDALETASEQPHLPI